MTARPLPPLLLRGDCIARMRDLPDASIDAIVTDPPYGLEFMGKEWDSFKPAAAHADARKRRAAEVTPEGRAHSTSAGPYLAASVNAYAAGPAFEAWVTTWATEALRVLKPGGHLLAFGGSRTWHRLAAGIEDAGFEVRDSIAWLYGSGFPKSLDVSKAIDKLDASAERLARSHRFTAWMRSTGLTAQRIDELTATNMGGHYLSAKSQPAVPTAELFEVLRPHLGDVPEWVERLVVERDVESRNFAARGSTKTHAEGITRGTSGAGGGGEGAEAKDVPHTPEAAAWQGWGTALKPAFEPIVVARKPLAGTVAANVLQYGTGALNIDASRVSWQSEERRRDLEAAASSGAFESKSAFGGGLVTGNDAGRWPANVMLDEGQAAALDAQTGTLKTGGNVRTRNADGERSALGAFAGQPGMTPTRPGDSGGASRFFYVAKAPKSERPVYWRPSCNCETIKPCPSPQRDTTESESGVVKSWSTSTSGKKRKGGKSRRATTSTIETGTSSTTTPLTSSLSPSSSTSASTPAANFEAASGGSPAASAASSSPSPSNTGTSVPKGGRSMAAADPAILSEWSETSVCANCGAPARREQHATVKPLALMRYLVTLVTPPGGVVLDPFAGSGTTLEAAYSCGFESIGVELTPDYWPLIEARIDRAVGKGPSS